MTLRQVRELMTEAARRGGAQDDKYHRGERIMATLLDIDVSMWLLAEQGIFELPDYAQERLRTLGFGCALVREPGMVSV